MFTKIQCKECSSTSTVDTSEFLKLKKFTCPSCNSSISKTELLKLQDAILKLNSNPKFEVTVSSSPEINLNAISFGMRNFLKSNPKYENLSSVEDFNEAILNDPLKVISQLTVGAFIAYHEQLKDVLSLSGIDIPSTKLPYHEL